MLPNVSPVLDPPDLVPDIIVLDVQFDFIQSPTDIQYIGLLTLSADIALSKIF